MQLPVFLWCAETDAKYTVGPLKVDATNIVVTVQRIEMEKVVCDSP